MLSAQGAPLAERKDLFYGWVIAGLSWVNQGLGYTVWYSFSIFFVALIQAFGWDRGSTAAVYSVFVLVGALAGPLVGALIDRYDPRLVMPLGAALTALGVGLCAQMTEPWQFYLAFGVLAGVGLTCIGMVANNAVLSRWFDRKLGTAAGLASTGVGAGIFLLVPLVQVLIDQRGWQAAYLTMATVLVLVLVPLNLLLQRRSPAALGLRPDGDGAAGAADARSGRIVVNPAWAARDWTLRDAAGTARFWLLFGGLAAATFAQQLLVVHQVAYLVDAGHSKGLAASVAGLFGAFAIPAKIACGAASDRYGREVAFAVGTGAFILAFPLLILAAAAHSYPLLVLYAALVGVGLGTIGPIGPGMVADIFGGRSYGSILGAIFISTGIGAALGAWFAGWIFDQTGDYRVAFAWAIVAAATAIILCLLAAPRNVRRRGR